MTLTERNPITWLLLPVWAFLFAIVMLMALVAIACGKVRREA